MKSLMTFILFATALTAQAQNFSPSAGAIGTQGPATVLGPSTTPSGVPATGAAQPLNQTSPSGAATTLEGASPSAIGNETFQTSAPRGADTTLNRPPMGDGTRLENTNTAPNPVPNDTSLIITPDNNPNIQSQQERENSTFPSNPGIGTGTGTGTDSSSGQGTGTGTGSDATPFNTFPETTR
ncbi:MAG: hypothetical protein H0V66_15570 [Bdellovibrionales bacterium]|nr:hypothetical protein [Bdellovibrionales bacterium]